MSVFIWFVILSQNKAIYKNISGFAISSPYQE